MMRRTCAAAIAIAVLAVCTTTDAAAQRRGGGRGMSRPPSMSRPSMPASRPAQPTRPSGGFNLPNDVGQGRGQGSRGLENRAGGGPPGYNNGANRPDRPARPPVVPVVPVVPAWGWNGGYPWYPAPGYYGGGFWGPFATGVVFGTVINEETKEETESYEVAPDSPGAKILSAYALTQAQCGGGNQVIIFGPNGSVVCAGPNEHVAAGRYTLDAENMTLSSVE